MTIERIPFGTTGHASSRIIFGAAALARASQDQADRALELLLAAGVNHIDAAASYGDAELRIGPWMEKHRDAFFLATKTEQRSYAGARDSIRRSLERLRVERIDLIQLHHLVGPEEWERALGPEGALRAATEAREAGQVRFIGVTGHGTRVAGMHRRSLERFPFDSVLLPYNFAMMNQSEYAAEFEELLGICGERGVAVQTIKSLARRRWAEGAEPTHSTWYQPFTEPGQIEVAIHWALSRPGIFVNSASDVGLLEHVLAAGESSAQASRAGEMPERYRDLGAAPLFVRGYGTPSAPRD
jgi:aryl-alcohol dehydrogenase-like predicted oxidoreductase